MYQRFTVAVMAGALVVTGFCVETAVAAPSFYSAGHKMRAAFRHRQTRRVASPAVQATAPSQRETYRAFSFEPGTRAYQPVYRARRPSFLRADHKMRRLFHR